MVLFGGSFDLPDQGLVAAVHPVKVPTADRSAHRRLSFGGNSSKNQHVPGVFGE
jgi:hypothetical protein